MCRRRLSMDPLTVRRDRSFIAGPINAYIQPRGDNGQPEDQRRHQRLCPGAVELLAGLTPVKGIRFFHDFVYVHSATLPNGGLSTYILAMKVYTQLRRVECACS
jgi:hypothetical protein